jgi:hypothetical protein
MTGGMAQVVEYLPSESSEFNSKYHTHTHTQRKSKRERKGKREGGREEGRSFLCLILAKRLRMIKNRSSSHTYLEYFCQVCCFLFGTTNFPLFSVHFKHRKEESII